MRWYAGATRQGRLVHPAPPSTLRIAIKVSGYIVSATVPGGMVSPFTLALFRPGMDERDAACVRRRYPAR